MKRYFLLLGIVVFLFSGFLTVNGQALHQAVVGFKNGTFRIISYSTETDFALLIQRFATQHDVQFVEKQSYFKAAIAPNDSLYPQQTTLAQIRAENAWSVTTGSASQVVAVIDNGVDIDHPDLAQNIWINGKEVAANGIDDDQNGFIDDVHGWDFVDGSANVKPRFNGSSAVLANHGTVVSGVAGAIGNNGVGVAGVAWQISIMPLRALNADGIGSSTSIASAITYAVNNGATIINLSLEGPTSSGAIVQAIQAARNKGAIVIAAAGNDNANLAVTPVYPACNAGVLGVASLNGSNGKSSFSNYGAGCVAVSAPGEGIVSTVSSDPSSGMSSLYTIQPGSQSGWAGTSFAAPYVAGVAALVKTALPDLTREQLETLLATATNSVDAQNPSYVGMLGSGIIDAALAVSSSPPTTASMNLLTLPTGGGGPHLKGFTPSGSLYLSKFVESTSYRGGGDLSRGDVNTDGTEEIIYAAGSGIPQTIKIFNAKGSLLKTFTAFSSPRNGLRVATGDTNGDGTDEIIAARVAGSTSEVRVFNEAGKVLSRFFVYTNGFTGGLSLASGDINDDGKEEIVVGSGQGGLPRVLVFTQSGKKLFDFLAYGKGFRGGVNVAVGNLTGDGNLEIVTSPMISGGPDIRIFSNAGVLLKHFFAYPSTIQKTGVSVSLADVTGSGYDSICVSPHAAGSSEARVYSFSGTLLKTVKPYGASFKGGFTIIGIKP